MESLWIISILLMSILSSLSSSVSSSSQSKSLPNEETIDSDTGVNILTTSYTQDGEKETRLTYNTIKAIETVTPEFGEFGLYYRQLTNGKQLVTAIFSGKGAMVDCDVTKDEDDISRFYQKFYDSYALPGDDQKSLNVTMRVLEGALEQDLVDLADLKNTKTICRALHRELKHELREKNRVEKQQHDHSGSKVEDQTENERSSRVKRAMFMYPGTNWCGTGNTADGFYDLGDNVATDKCCRTHDHCPYTVEGFTSKFNMWNYRFHTLSHCNCDETLRACLKSAGNSVANMVGNIFFNVVSTKCFVLKPEAYCSRRSWWGKCEKYENKYYGAVEQALVY